MRTITTSPVPVTVFSTEQEMGVAGAERVLHEVRRARQMNKKPVLWLMAAPSGFSFYRALVGRAVDDPATASDLDGVEVFQFDDYPIARDAEQFPVTFRSLLEELVVHPMRRRAGVELRWHPLELTDDDEHNNAVTAEYQSVLESRLDDDRAWVVEVKGIGMDGHWGFHGAETPLDSPPAIINVAMNAENIAQQMIDWPQFFTRPEDVPKEAYSCNVALFLRADAVVDLVPQASKEYSVLATYANAVVVEAIPSSALKRHDNAVSYVTAAAARALVEYVERRDAETHPPLTDDTWHRLVAIWRNPDRPRVEKHAVETMTTVLRGLEIVA